MQPLTPAELTAALARLPGWTHRAGALERTLRFASFPAAIAWMARLAPEIERLGHHPEWSNVYNRVSLRLTTHDAGNLVTARDLELALLIDAQSEKTV